MNPASMFVGFISPKEFFSVINRKHVENHKLNLFDVNLDPIEFKIGFWEKSRGETEEDLDHYFSYCVAANLNGYTFYSPANLANAMTMLAAIYFKDALEEMPEHCFVQALFSTYLLSFAMMARIKVFPDVSEKEKFNWFVEIFFDFYKMTFKHLDTKISKEDFELVKKKLLNQTSFFFLLYHFYQRLNMLIAPKSDEGVLNWLFSKDNKDKLISAFKGNYHTTKFIPHFSPLEQSVMVNIWPGDIMIKYLLGTSDAFIAVDAIISKIFPRNEIDPLVQSFLKNGENLNSLLEYLMDEKKYKHGFFAGIQNYVIKLFRSEGKEEILEEIDEMLSAIDNGEDINPFDMPERIKRESKVMERLLNFYVMMMGWWSIARADSVYLRLFYPELVSHFGNRDLDELISSPTQINFLSNINFQYHKSRFYYEYINAQLRNSKQKLMVPVDTMPSDVSSNVQIFWLNIQGAICSFFQDLNVKSTRLTLKNPQLLDLFKEKYGKLISERVQLDKADLIKEFYAPMAEIIGGRKSDFLAFLKVVLERDEAVSSLKDALYRLDFWAHYQLMQKVKTYKYGKIYGMELCFSIFGQLRELLFGWLLLAHALKKYASDPKATDQNIKILLTFLLADVVGVANSGEKVLFDAIGELGEELAPLLELWMNLDDNEQFLQFICKNISSFLHQAQKSKPPYFTGDDLIWFRGLLKNIAYYNKRFIIPE